MPDNTTDPEKTAANTRRNSFIDLEASRYFNAAAALLDDVPEPRKNMIMPRRKSSYYADPWVEVPATEDFIADTSPQRADYTTQSDLAILRRGPDAIWMSSTHAVPKDLKSLTRSGSREHGTLSQSCRRRPSLPFQSPTKLR